MIRTDVRASLPTDAIVLDNHSYDNSIIGVTFDGRVIYDYDSMVEEFMMDEECTEEEAIEWIDYNTLRALPYIGGKAPIVVCDMLG